MSVDKLPTPAIRLLGLSSPAVYCPLASQSPLSAPLVLRTTSGAAIDWLEPTARNSNLLPVKANGLVRLRSPACLGKGGNTSTPTVIVPPDLEVNAGPFSNCVKMSDNWSPRNIEI